MLAAYYGMTLGVVTTLLAIVLAAIPLTIVIPTFLWLDRYEAEPDKYLVAAFLWGALVAALLAGLINTSAHVVFSSATNPEQARLATAVFFAPVVEEAAKGLLRPARLEAAAPRVRRHHRWHGLRRHRRQPASRSPRTSSTSAWPTTEGGEQVLTAVFIARCLVTPFAHPIFTVMSSASAWVWRPPPGAGC